MIAFASRALAWLAGTRAGQIVAALVTGFVTVIVLRAKWRADGAAANEAKHAVEAARTMERVDEAAARYRASGAADSMRNGTF